MCSCIAVATAARFNCRHERFIFQCGSKDSTILHVPRMHTREQAMHKMLRSESYPIRLCASHAHTRAGHAQHECDDFVFAKPNIGGYIYIYILYCGGCIFTKSLHYNCIIQAPPLLWWLHIHQIVALQLHYSSTSLSGSFGFGAHLRLSEG